MFLRSMLGAVSRLPQPPDRLSCRRLWPRESRLLSGRRKLGADQVSREPSLAKPLERKIRRHSNSNRRNSNLDSSPRKRPGSNLTSNNSRISNNNRRPNNNSSNQQAQSIEWRIMPRDAASAGRETLRSLGQR